MKEDFQDAEISAPKFFPTNWDCIFDFKALIFKIVVLYDYIIESRLESKIDRLQMKIKR